MISHYSYMQPDSQHSFMKKSSRKVASDRYGTRGIRINYAEESEESPRDSNDVSNSSEEPLAKVASRDLENPPAITELDDYCFKCHKCIQRPEDRQLCAFAKCGRSYHRPCARALNNSQTAKWLCPFCQDISKYEKKCKTHLELWRVNKLSRQELNELLGMALDKLKKDMDPFYGPVDPRMYPTYYQVIVHPMSLLKIQQRIDAKEYATTAEFRSDMSWILHNCVVFNSTEHPLSGCAKKLIFNARQETMEIESCPECYRSVLTTESWFTGVCHPPHALVWAKLAGYPYWPAKVISVGNEAGGSATASSSSLSSALQMRVRVHFFHDHTKQKLLPTEVFFLSEQSPPDGNKNRSGFSEAISELNRHIENIRNEFGCFHYYPSGLPFSLQPMLQLWMINVPSEEAISNSRSLSRESFNSQICGMLKLKDNPQNRQEPSVNPANMETASNSNSQPAALPSSSSVSEVSEDSNTPECPETKSEKRHKLKAALLTNREEAMRRFAKPLFGVIPEKLPKFNLLDIVDRLSEVPEVTTATRLNTPSKASQSAADAATFTGNENKDVRSASSASAIITDSAAMESKQPLVNLEEVFTKAVEAFHKKQQLQLALSLRTAFAVFREEASRDMPDASLTSFLKSCDALQVKCEDNIVSSFQQAVTGCVKKCAAAAQEAQISVPVSITSSSKETKSGGDATSNNPDNSLDAFNARLVECERAEFVSTLIQAMATDTERQLNDAKNKHWCTNCRSEATLHCCRYASYCSYDCQTRHWTQHRQICCQILGQRPAQPAPS